MQLVAILKDTGLFFRSQSVGEDDIGVVKQAIQNDSEKELDFIIMAYEEYENWLHSQ